MRAQRCLRPIDRALRGLLSGDGATCKKGKDESACVLADCGAGGDAARRLDETLALLQGMEPWVTMARKAALEHYKTLMSESIRKGDRQAELEKYYAYAKFLQDFGKLLLTAADLLDFAKNLQGNRDELAQLLADPGGAPSWKLLAKLDYYDSILGAVQNTADMADGVRYVKQRPSITLLVLTSFAVIMVGFPYQSFLPSVAKDVYGVGSGGLGALQSLGAVGAVVATLLVASYAQSKRAWAAQPILAIAFGGSLVGLGLAPNIWLGLVAMVAVGGLAGGFQGVNNALTMSSTESDYQGRVQSISMLSWSLFGLFALPIGIVADHIGIQETLIVMGGVVMGSVLLLQLFGRTEAVNADRRARVNALEMHAAEVAGAPAGGR